MSLEEIEFWHWWVAAIGLIVVEVFAPGTVALWMGVSAAVVGLLLGGLADPVWTGASHRPADFALAVAAFAGLALWRAPPWLVVIACGLAGAALGAL